MRRKWRLIISIIVMVLIFGLMIFATVGALTNVGLGGDIVISGENLEVTITGKIYGHKQNNMTEDTAEEIGTATWDINTPTEDGGNSLDWSDLPLNFVDKDEAIVIIIDIKNNHLTNSVLLGVENKSEVEGKNFTVDIAKSETLDPNQIAVGESVRYTITLKITDSSKKVEGKLNLIFSLTNIEANT